MQKTMKEIGATHNLALMLSSLAQNHASCGCYPFCIPVICKSKGSEDDNILAERDLTPYLPLSTFVERGTKGGEVMVRQKLLLTHTLCQDQVLT